MGDCSAVVLNHVPEKLSDPGVFTIPCLFGSDVMSHTLADLGASINLMPYSLYEKLELGELTPTRMSLSLTDRSVKYPRGIIENLLVKVDNCESEAGFVEKPAPLELKVLPSHLEYAYLDEGSNFLVIVSSKLMEEEKTKLIDVLKLHKGAIAWRLSDIQGLTGGHHGAHATAQKVFDSGFYWLTVVKDVEEFVKLSDACRRTAIDYVSKWVEAQALATNDARVVLRFLKKLFTRFGTPRAIISDRGTHFCNAVMEKPLALYGTVGVSRKDWSKKLDDALWAFRIAYKTPLGTRPFMLVYGKSCHLPVELEHCAFWALKKVNVDLTEAARKRYFQIHELEELQDAAYSRSLKDGKEFKKGDKVLLFNSRLKLFAGKLRSKWTGPYLVKEVFLYGVVELENPDNGKSWKVNGHRLKHYLGGPEESIEMEETPLDPSH
ncbi:uncharacterized protein LOC143582055 [Bidens hawaiensis]|uniref:uncharacterized protein LOC143582055 n=1 Tax=Bidens hawaiensis TaxID=980011 RepID=UPI0040497BDC